MCTISEKALFVFHLDCVFESSAFNFCEFCSDCHLSTYEAGSEMTDVYLGTHCLVAVLLSKFISCEFHMTDHCRCRINRQSA